jgi:hypothetical protein
MNQTRKPRSILVSSIGLASVVVLLWLVVGESLLARPAALGLRLAIPSSTFPILGADSLTTGNGPEIETLTLSISDSGRVTGVAPSGVITVDRLNRLQQYFARVTFLPASRNDTLIRSQLRVEAILSADTTACVIRYPITADSSISDQSLYAQSLRLNGVATAAWKQFPWFHAGLHSEDTTYLLRYALISLGLSAKGKVTHADLVGTNYPGYAEQVASAAKYGSFLPAKRGVRNVSSDNLLLITFFPSVSYPTKPLVSTNLDTVSWHYRYLVRMMPDSFGLMTDPIPRQPTPGIYQMQVPAAVAYRDLLMNCRIDSVGKISLIPFGVDTTGLKQFCKSLSEQMRFYPGMDFHGRPKPFDGLVQLSNRGGAIVRIEYLWLR